MEIFNSPVDNLRRFFSGRSVLSRLMIINIVIFLAINLISLVFWLFQDGSDSGQSHLNPLLHWLAVPSYLPELAGKPWTPLTYMFTQENFFHLLFNMVVLYFGGNLMQAFGAGRKILTLYITGGLAGALFYVISYNTFPVFVESRVYSLALGSSAAVLAIMIATATLRPDYSVGLFLLGNVKLKYIAIILVVMDVLNIQKGNAGGHLAHLGGALWGFLFIRAGVPGASLLRLPWRFPLLRRRMRVRQNSDKNWQRPARPVTDEQYNAERAERQRRIDRILEKISKSGYENLTREEKDMLFDAGKKE